MNGVLIIDKPAGPTSHAVVARVRRAIGLEKIGHTGTLDPIATGVLPLVVGRATRLARYLSAREKTYDAEIRLGMSTDTYDGMGRVLAPDDSLDAFGSKRCRGGPSSAAAINHGARARGSAVEKALVDRTAMECVLESFRGTFWQAPPPFSAKKIAGVRAYKLARRQVAIEPKPAQVTVYTLNVASYVDNRLVLRLVCSPGFYVRALAHALGERLGCGAYLAGLRRVRSGDFGIEDAVPLDLVEKEGPSAAGRIIPTSRLLTSLPEVVLTDRGAERAGHGVTISAAEIVSSGPVPLVENSVQVGVRLVDRHGRLIAIAEQINDGGLLHPTVVLV